MVETALGVLVGGRSVVQIDDVEDGYAALLEGEMVVLDADSVFEDGT